MKQLFFYLSILFLVSCRKSFDNTNQVNKIVLPSYTETGANTFGFMLNNNVWTVFGKHYFNNGISSGYIDNVFEVTPIYTGVNEVSIYGGGRFTIVKNDTAVTDISAGFSFLPTLPFTKDYYLTTTDPGNFSIVDITNNKYYKVDPNRPLTLQLKKFEKIYTLVRIFSGRFFGVVHNEVDPNDSIIITDGRFDTKIIYR